MSLAPEDYNMGPESCYAMAKAITCRGDKADEARKMWARGFIFMINYNHEEAIACFTEVTKLDDKCAMAWWGIAYGVSSNYNWPPGLGSGHDACTAAMGLLEGLTELEVDLITALSKRHSAEARDGANPAALSMGNSPELNAAFAEAMAGVYEKYKGNLDVAAIYAEGLMNLKPWALWNRDAKTGEITPADDNTLKAIKVIEDAFEVEGGKVHPPLCHLYCHALELSPFPEKALPAADTLRTLMPDCGHLVHMPSHIDAWVGQWKEGIDANVAGANADDKYVKQSGKDSMFYKFYRNHNKHFIVWCAMHDGQYETAMKWARQMQDQLQAGDKDSGVSFMLAGIIPMGAIFLESYTTMPLMAMIRFGKWDEIIAEPQKTDEAVFPVYIATQHYARGVAFASKGMVKEAEEEQVKFEAALKNPALAGRVLHNNKQYQDPAEGPSILNVSRHVLEGEIAYRKGFIAKAAGDAAAEGHFTEAFDKLRKGVDLSLNLAYNEPWGQMQPIRHILGALLFEQEKYEEAEAVYRDDIKMWKDNMWGLLGLKLCLEKKGDAAKEECEKVSKLFDERSARADNKPTATCYCAQLSGGAAAEEAKA